MNPAVLAPMQQIAQVLYTDVATSWHSLSIAQRAVAEGIPGDIVECGVAAGGNFAAMILGALESGGHDRKFWGFDSFQGIQLAGKWDRVQPGIGDITHDINVPDAELLVSSGVSSHSRESVIENLTRWGLWGLDIELIEGWVQHTLPVHARRIERIAVLRLDMDIYDPTKVALEWLWDKVSPGGMVIIDDWELDGARRAFVEYLKDARGLDYQHLQIARNAGEWDQGYFVKP